MASQGTATSRLAQIQEFTALARFSSDGALNNNYQHIAATKLNESWAGRRLIEALNQLPPSKFGSSTDMRFQQKQLQEREQRRMEMAASKVKVPEIVDSEPTTKFPPNSTASKSLNSTIGNGKVRQMFNERRRGAGIDRSNPLKPITSRSSSSSSTVTTASVSSKTTLTRRQEVTALRPINGRTIDKNAANKLAAQKIDDGNDSVDFSYDENTRITHKQETYRADDDDLDSETFPEQQQDNFENFEIKLPAKLEALILDNAVDQHEDNNNNPPPQIKFRPSAGIKLNPVLTKKSPPVTVARTPAKPSRTVVTAKPAPTKSKTIEKSSPKMAKPLANANIAFKGVQRAKTPPTHPPGTAPCRICNRFFNEDRLSKHEDVCEKMAMKKRKIFDASKHRVKGTEAEKFLKKPMRASKTVSVAAKTSTTSTTSTPSTDASKKSNWRKKHEEFIAAIRAAKEVQAYLAKGGKLSDLPPPPRSENPDYITCPHCSRRFNEAAATRHIPKCANMMHNKPKPAPKRR